MNKESEREIWKTILSEVRLVHVNTSAVLKVCIVIKSTLQYGHNNDLVSGRKIYDISEIIHQFMQKYVERSHILILNVNQY